MMNQTNSLMVAILVALGVMLVAGLIAIPAIHEARAIAVPAKRPSCSFTPGACKTGHP
jgi:hypothetical protein